MESHKNNFDFIRLFAASLVVYAHSFELLVSPNQPSTIREPLIILSRHHLSPGTLGVWIFFCISGYLIAQSLTRSRDYKSYFVKRSLRIFPALITDLLIAVFIWGALVTTLPLSEYFSSFDTYRYLQNVFLYKIIFNLPGVFINNPYPNVINGSLWTLPQEFACYVGLALLHWTAILKNRLIYAVFYCASLIAGLFILNTRFFEAAIPGTSFVFNSLFTVAAFFGAGTLFYLFRDKIPLKASVALVLLIVWFAGFYLDFPLLFNYLCLPYIVLWFVFEPRLALHQAGKYGDFSYGIYIYSFPVQQTIIYYLGSDLPVPVMILLSFLLTIPLAVFSWFVIEKKALRIKDKLFSSRSFAEGK